MDKLTHKFMIGIFGDNKEHSYDEIFCLGWTICGKDKKKFESIFKKCREYNLISKLGRTKTPLEEKFKLSSKGDNYIRDTAVRYGGDFSYYKYMDRSPESYAKHSKEDNIRG